MKTFLIATIFLVAILAACNNKKQENSTSQKVTLDTLASTLTDLSASTDIKKLLAQDWENKEDAEDAALSGGSEGIETTYRGFSFFADGTVTENPRDKMRLGKWTMNDEKVISIDFGKEGKSQYKIAAIGARQMILMNMSDKKKTEYRADAKVQENPAEDPFYGTNNLWRIKPMHAESDSAIKLRTEACLLFYAKYLADNAARGNKTISFTGLPTCFKWYRGGVSVTNQNKLDAKWLNCYYSDEEAIKGQQMLEKIISKKYKWNKEEKHWVKQSADVVKQMYDTLRAL